MKELVAHSQDTSTTFSRPLGPTESYFLRMGRGRGWADPFFVTTFSFHSPSSTSSYTLLERIKLAWATFLARNLLAASIVIGNPDSADFVYRRPNSAADALEQADKTLEYIRCSSATLKDELDSLRARWGGPILENSLPNDKALTRFALIENHDQSGTHAIAIYGTHFISDLFAVLGATKEIFTLLVSPSDPRILLEESLQARAEFPPTIDYLIEEKRLKNRKGSEADAIDAYRSLSAPAKLTRHGLIPDGNAAPENITQIVDRQVLSIAETTALVKASKVHGFSITSVIAAVLSFVACEMTTPPSGSRYFGKIHLPIDLSSRGARGSQPGDHEFALRAGRYPVWVDLSPPSVPSSSDAERTWELAKICQDTQAKFISSPHFWDFLVYYSDDSLAALNAGPPPSNANPVPMLPLFSSIGRLDTAFPAKFGTKANEEGQVVVEDIEVNMKVLPVTPSVHVWTYKGRLSMQLTYSDGYTSKELMGIYWKRVVDHLKSLAGN